MGGARAWTRWLTGGVARRRAAAVVGAVGLGVVVVWAGSAWFAFPRELHVTAGTDGVRSAPGGESVPYEVLIESPDDGRLHFPGDRIVMRWTGGSRLGGWLRAIGLGRPACVGYRFSGTFRAEGPGRDGWFHLVREDEWSDEEDRDVRLVRELLQWHSGPSRDPAALRTCFDDLFPTALGAVHRVWDHVCDRLPESEASDLAGAVARSIVDRIGAEEAFRVSDLVRRQPGFSEMATALPGTDGEGIVFQELHRRPGDVRLLRVASTAYAESGHWNDVTMLVALSATVEAIELTIPWVPAEFRECMSPVLVEREARETSPEVRERLRRAREALDQ